jgi:hypothetical protein
MNYRILAWFITNLVVVGSQVNAELGGGGDPEWLCEGTPLQSGTIAKSAT